jgi:uncharacterized membrane protein (Fun14 family)
MSDNLMGAILNIISNESLLGLPTTLFMTLPFILGLIIGFFIKKALRMALILSLIAGVSIYFGVINLEQIKDLVINYGGVALHYATILIGMLPLSIGLIIGMLFGLKYG